MWLIGISLAIGALGIRMLAFRRWRRAGSDDDLGWMSQQWLAEQRAAVHR